MRSWDTSSQGPGILVLPLMRDMVSVCLNEWPADCVNDPTSDGQIWQGVAYLISYFVAVVSVLPSPYRREVAD